MGEDVNLAPRRRARAPALVQIAVKECSCFAEGLGIVAGEIDVDVNAAAALQKAEGDVVADGLDLDLNEAGTGH